MVNAIEGTLFHTAAQPNVFPETMAKAPVRVSNTHHSLFPPQVLEARTQRKVLTCQHEFYGSHVSHQGTKVVDISHLHLHLYLYLYLSKRFAQSSRWCSNPTPTLNQARIYSTPTLHKEILNQHDGNIQGNYCASLCLNLHSTCFQGACNHGKLKTTMEKSMKIIDESMKNMENSIKTVEKNPETSGKIDERQWEVPGRTQKKWKKMPT